MEVVELLQSLVDEAETLNVVSCRGECGIWMSPNLKQCSNCGWENPLAHITWREKE